MNGISTDLASRMEAFKRKELNNGTSSARSRPVSVVEPGLSGAASKPLSNGDVRPMSATTYVCDDTDVRLHDNSGEIDVEAVTVTREFVLAGKAIFTIEVPEAYRVEKPHYTFQVNKVEAHNQYQTDAYFAKLLTGPDNNGEYSYVGKLNPDDGQVAITRASRFTTGSYPVQLLNRVLSRVWDEDHSAYLAYGFHVHHEGKCGRCGRRLTVPESITSGIGPECAKHFGG